MSTNSPATDILLVDANDKRRETLREAVTRHRSCVAASSSEMAKTLTGAAALLVAGEDIEHSKTELRRLQQRFSPDRIAVLSLQPVEHQLEHLISAGATQFLSASGIRMHRELEWQLKALLDQDSPISLQHLFEGMLDVKTLQIRDRWERHEAVERTLDYFSDSEFPDNVVDIQLALDEMLNNAMYHAFKGIEGEEKYSSETFDSLQGDDSVLLQIARDPEYNILSVSDNAGTLAPHVVMQNLVRHLTLKGLLDEHGRGFFLMRSVSDGMLIRIEPQVRTQMVLVFGRHSNSVVKSLMVQKRGATGSSES